jgi:SAM-dependent methyltransferase
MQRSGLREILETGYGKVLRYLSPVRYREYAVGQSAARYDMRREPSEDYYAGIYLRFIREDLGNRFGSRKLEILDVGCGQGRLSIPLARDGHSLAGTDISGEAIRMARAYAGEEGVTVDWIEGDLSSLRAAHPGRLFDCILCTEVLYMAEDPVPLLQELLGFLRPGGILLLSLRTRYYYLLSRVKGRDWPSASLVAKGSSGELDGLPFNWHTKPGAEAMLSRLGLRAIRFRGIGICSGIPGDPLGAICIPSKLDPGEQDALRDIELLLAEEYAGNGRYLYIAAEMPARPGA